MATRMLIDARHPEETRVAVLKGNRIEEFDFESSDCKQIKGNIYLAKVTRVEPSLQAAFVDFGGNRHGFLAFSEIHPDYYQIPKEDREALLAEEAQHAEEEAALRAAEDGDEDEDESDDLRDDIEDGGGVTEVDTSDKDEIATIEAGHVENGFSEDGEEEEDRETGEAQAANGEADADEDQPRRRGRRRQGGRGRSKAADELRDRRMALRRRYKIQDVIHRRQVLLVQVVKEERGNKGAALTTYLSLAGRYCVLMPNSSHGGGISRKISSTSDRKRLKAIISELELPKSMGCIVRTAGVSRTKTEIKRDFDYLARLWDEIRERTLNSSAPALIHSDSDLIKRAIRDIYNREIEDVVVEGEAGFRAARDFMKLLMPSHARRVKAYSDPVPLFQRYGAEDQLTAMYEPVVQLKSGGYIVINPTEALVSIDINSGRSTKEYGIEATALNTNLEAAHEIARQLRLRDMAGLVVIDFIDMEYSSSIRKVEKAMKEALKNDRARIQVGRISSFGLMEMSRQRLRTGVLEATTRTCPHCDGTGLVRTASSSGLAALRLIEDEAAKGRGSVISLFASTEASIYLLNAKRADLAEIETRYGVQVEVIPEGENEGAKMRVTSSGPRPEFVPKFEPIVDDYEDEELSFEDEDEEIEDAERADGDADTRRKRRKRRRSRGKRDERDEQSSDAAEASEDEGEDGESSEAESGQEEDAPRKRRRRGRRRRGNRERNGEAGDGVESEVSEEVLDGDGSEEESPVEAVVATTDGNVSDEALTVEVSETDAEVDAEAEAGAEPEVSGKSEAPAEPQAQAEPEAPVEPEAQAEPEAKPKARRARKPKAAEPEAEQAPEGADGEAVPAKPKRTRRKKVEAAEPVEAATGEAPVGDVPTGEAPASGEPTAEEAPKPKRTRRKKADASAEAGSPASPAAPEADSDSAAETPDAVAVTAAADEPATANDDGEPEPPRRGWWQRTFGN